MTENILHYNFVVLVSDDGVKDIAYFCFDNVANVEGMSAEGNTPLEAISNLCQLWLKENQPGEQK